MSRRPDRFLALAGVAAGGVVLGHVVAYAVAFPSALARHAHLAATGHGSFGSVARAGITALVLATAGIAARSLRTSGGPDPRRAALVLGAFQVMGFTSLELAERGFSLARTVGDPAVVLGLAIQVALALLIALALSSLVRVVRAIAAHHRRRPSTPRRGSFPFGGTLTPHGRWCASYARRRAPPLVPTP